MELPVSSPNRAAIFRMHWIMPQAVSAGRNGVNILAMVSASALMGFFFSFGAEPSSSTEPPAVTWKSFRI